MALIYAKNKLEPITVPTAGSVWTRRELETLSVEDQLKAVKTPEKTATHTPIPQLLVSKARTAQIKQVSPSPRRNTPRSRWSTLLRWLRP